MGKTTEKPTRHLELPVGPQLKAVLKIAYRARLPVLLEGPTGIGKSEIIGQLTDELDIERVVVDLSLLEPPDLVGLPQIEGGRTSFAQPSILPTSGAGILMLEELNRAERYIQQPALQLLTARRLHEYKLPDGWSTCAAVNPAKQNYQVTPLDPALLARFLRLVVCANRGPWLDWVLKNGIHPVMTNGARMHDRVVEDVAPRTWTCVSRSPHTSDLDELWEKPLLRRALGEKRRILPGIATAKPRRGPPLVSHFDPLPVRGASLRHRTYRSIGSPTAAYRSPVGWVHSGDVFALVQYWGSAQEFDSTGFQ